MRGYELGSALGELEQWIIHVPCSFQSTEDGIKYGATLHRAILITVPDTIRQQPWFHVSIGAPSLHFTLPFLEPLAQLLTAMAWVDASCRKALYCPSPRPQSQIPWHRGGGLFSTHHVGGLPCREQATALL